MFCFLIGMEVVGLKTFIEKHPLSVQLVFPSQQFAKIDVNEMKSKIVFEDDGSDTHNVIKETFLQYIDIIDTCKEGILYVYGLKFLHVQYNLSFYLQYF